MHFCKNDESPFLVYRLVSSVVNAVNNRRVVCNNGKWSCCCLSNLDKVQKQGCLSFNIVAEHSCSFNYLNVLSDILSTIHLALRFGS